MDVIPWITTELAPEAGTSSELLYERMASQSGRSLPVLYEPFNPNDAGHWRDRGAALDFVLSTHCAGKRVLDIGPGDGWPSLIIAPAVAEVVGIEGAHRRVAVCRENAARLGIGNATFHPAGPTWLRWMREAGFSDARPTHSAIYVAEMLFRRLHPGRRPTTMAEIDAYLRPIAEVTVELSAPAEMDPMITAVK